MGTNISANLFASAPAVAANGVNSVKAVSSVDSRSTATSQQGKDFSSELKNASADDKAAVMQQEAKAAAAETLPTKEAKADTVGKESGGAEEKTDLAAEETVAADVDELGDAAESLVAAQVAVNAAPMPMAELTTYVQSAEQPVAMMTEEPIQTALMAEVLVQQADASEADAALQVVQQSEETVNLTQQPVGQAQQSVSQAQQPVAGVQPQMVQQPEVKADMPQPKSIEALLKPVDGGQQTAVENPQSQAPTAMSNEQQMLAVLSGKRYINNAPQADSSQPVEPQTQIIEPVAVRTADAAPRSEATANPTLEDVNNLLGQDVKVVTGASAKQNLNPDGQSNQQQSFQQEQVADTAQAFTTSQVVESKETSAFTVENEPVQAASVLSGQPAVTDTVQVETQQPVSQARTDYHITQQIVEQARLIRNAENTEMVIKLNPRHLGDLTLKVAVNSNGGVTATFHTDNAQVRALLETSMIQLQKELNDQGIKVDSVEVQTGLADGQLPEGQSQGYYQQQAQQSARSQKLDLKDFEEDVDQLSAEPVNNATDVIRDSEGNKISDGVDYAV
ncbi:MAG: flagellar hook-length control protein FliK [Anaerovibrio sp.]|uniref:flagellar hook-length control protein FliK n=1 Tax=Anaerovibrio sp. TaxID=1872532 RepID=UPI0025C1BA88|nr:flagellar hook-length control protein FliK [Anaerovibrio sp.]MBE6099050.1 flagellar hook-length control protein FliK [Anaerovibrio sp.]